ncbi:host attachment family protein [Altererythrobacter litoralis]|uniref:Host attachment family protein n=1 Tax=Altererythrobacter litoralis TaxID=3113904 RepID=A0ABU7GC01_9SPHN|nr:host attachment family protein [Erythrobacteraceae bacterium 1XM1-14]
MQIENGTWVVIADGEKFLLLHNAGDTKYINLQLVEHERNDNAPAHELASDRPGRRSDSTHLVAGGGKAWGRSSLEETDWHKVAEERFAEHVAERLGEGVSQGRFQKLVMVADPRTLGNLRQAYGADLKSAVVAEIAKDLTNHPLDQIEAIITAFDEG